MIWIILSVTLWGAIHSFTSSLKLKNYLERKIGARTMRFYRLFFNILSAISFLPILSLMRALPDRTLYQSPSPWMYVMFFGQGLAALGGLIGLLQTDLWEFTGLRQVISPHTTAKGNLIITGLYKHMRHPLYTFGLLIIWLTPVMTQNTVTLYLILTLYIIIGAYFEEQKLLREFGQAYATYQSNTPMLVPKLNR